jgi:hypothetical protein
MSENKTKKSPSPGSEKTGRHDKRLDERRQRQAEALRANLKKRKSQIRGRHTQANTGD